ncbi:IS66 family insertion sequence element accessory protein TnpB [Streptococcus suis]|nr:IS66 family insertion sequence element accessory protein TnpB [Streptococcus suis]
MSQSTCSEVRALTSSSLLGQVNFPFSKRLYNNQNPCPSQQGIDSLAYLVKSQFNLDPFSGQVYLFCGGRKDRFKALYWDGQGFWLLYKRFENGKLTWPNNEEEVKALTSEQVDWLMKGFSISPKINVSKSRDFY